MLRVSACGVLFWEKGKCVWDDYLSHRQYALTEDAERTLRWFAKWRPIDSIHKLGNDELEGKTLIGLALQLQEAEILISQDSARHMQEENILADWDGWGPLVRAVHFSTRTFKQAQFADADVDQERLSAKLSTSDPPKWYKQYADAPKFALPELRPDSWHTRDLLTALQARRSVRKYGKEPLSFEKLAEILRIAATPTRQGSTFGTVFKTSPSAGGRHPTEFYVVALNVRDLEPGVYHYNSSEEGLERIAPAISPQKLSRMCGDQTWVTTAGAILVYTCVVTRNLWKYADSPRAYWTLFMDVGHLNQTVSLLATALGIETTFTSALRDEYFEELFDCDPSNEFILGCATLGSRDE